MEQDVAFFQMDFRGEAGIARFLAQPITPIREERCGRFVLVDFGYKIQKNGWTGSESWLGVCLERGAPSQLPGECLEALDFWEQSPTRLKTAPKSPEQKTLGACPGKIDSILKENSESPSWLGDAFPAGKK